MIFSTTRLVQAIITMDASQQSTVPAVSFEPPMLYSITDGSVVTDKATRDDLMCETHVGVPTSDKSVRREQETEAVPHKYVYRELQV